MNYVAKNIINGEDPFLIFNLVFNIVFLLKYLKANEFNFQNIFIYNHPNFRM